MQYNQLITDIQADIYSNGAELITGDILQNVLVAMVGGLAAAGACYKGVITTSSAAPADLDQATIYLALTAGTYTNFRDSNNDPIVTTGPALIIYEGGPSLVFSKTDLPFATTGDLSNYLELDGGTMGGAINMDGYAIQNVPDPVNNGDAANKDYVDSKQPWKVTIEPDADMSYILIKLGEPSHSCILAIDSASGAGALHGILCIDENFDITGAVFAGSGGLDTTVDAKSGYDDNSPRNFIAVLKFRNDQPVTLTCIGGNAPQSAEAIDALGGETFTSTRAWTDLEAGGGGGGDEQTSNKKTDIPANRTSETYYPNTKGVFDLTSKWGKVSQTLTWNSSDNSYSVSDVVEGAIPQSFIALVTKAGATFNTSTGYFELNGITNIAYDEMQEIYDHRTGYGTNSVLAIFGSEYTARTNFPLCWGYELSYPNHEPTTFYSRYLGIYNASITKFALTDNIATMVIRTGTGNNFDSREAALPIYRSRLEEIIGIINVQNLTGGSQFFYPGALHPWLKTFYMSKVSTNQNLSGMPSLLPASVAYMINNAGTATITITLHATAYAAATADADVQAALSAHTNVSLASA